VFMMVSSKAVNLQTAFLYRDPLCLCCKKLNAEDGDGR
jgi:hypothetical protein